MKPRYHKQAMRLDCFPAAIGNMLKWAGYKISYKEERFKLYKITNFISGMGTDLRDCSKFLKTSAKGLNIKRKRKPKYKDVVNHLKNGGSIIFTYQVELDYFHTAFIIEFKNKKFKFVNHASWELFSRVSKKDMLKYLRRMNVIHFIEKV